MPARQQHTFAQVPKAEIQRSTFDRSHGHKTTFDAGWLIPVFLDEALPGDTFNLAMSGFCRLATPLKPIMDNLFLESFFFAVPLRLLWDNWEKFNGAQTNPGDSTDYLIPRLELGAGSYGEQGLADYLGLPIGVANLNHSSLPFRAYAAIYNDWFRDQNLINSIPVPKDNGPDGLSGGYGSLQRRGKRHDYFTSCLPWPQKGTAVSIPLGSSAPVIPASAGAAPKWKDPSNAANLGDLVDSGLGTVNDAQFSWGSAYTGGGAPPQWHQSGLIADMTAATATTINALRQAFQIQRLLERDARGGTRYTEILKAHFGVTSPDARLQRPEYLGGGHAVIQISPVAQTAPQVASGTPQANLAGIGTGSWNGHGWVKSFTEHCIIMGMVSVRADLNYQQGLERHWSRRTRYDFYWPALAHIGEQAVLNKEIYFQGTAADDNVFGYQERYAEYRYKPSRISGRFRSTATLPLDVWHLAQDFANLPTLNKQFIEEDPPIDRVVATPDEPHFLMDSWFHLKCVRPMPVFGVPGLIDHF